MVADAARSAEVPLQDRLYLSTPSDRALQPTWQVYSTRHHPGTAPPANAPTWSRLLWRTRSALYRTAVRLGLCDLNAQGVRAASQEGARRAARELPPEGPRTNVDVRPLDGLEGAGIPPYGEGEANRAVLLFTSLLIGAALLLSFARDAPPLGKVLFGTLAIGSAAVGWRRALALPLGGTRARAVPVALIFSLLMLLMSLGIPGVNEGVSRRDALVYGLSSYYIAGLVLLTQRWRWQGLLVAVLPVFVTLAASLLPVTRTLLHDLYADILSLTPAETEVSTAWELAATVQLLWPSFVALLGVAAGWGLARYFHLVRGNAYFEVLVFALVAALAELAALDVTFSSPQRAATALNRAADERTPAPPYFGVNPSWVCVTPSVPTKRLNEKGGTLTPQRPYISFGTADSHVVLWNTETEAPLRVPAEQVRLTPTNLTTRAEGRCPSASP
ncbi:hypothetical protein [Streptomyces iconiensis]|uniref:Uncharacterized protein n=1 Tax=Streptomyces iconiensis TaxID=1384038 RepID=A0ABT6ZSI5_9ACTN|nr:hypothetical protein [Streptomyces iconiensis]MDJ1132022.1 hypothetical protein [Streptomyces iconiensis]